MQVRPGLLLLVRHPLAPIRFWAGVLAAESGRQMLFLDPQLRRKPLAQPADLGERICQQAPDDVAGRPKRFLAMAGLLLGVAAACRSSVPTSTQTTCPLLTAAHAGRSESKSGVERTFFPAGGLWQRLKTPRSGLPSERNPGERQELIYP